MSQMSMGKRTMMGRPPDKGSFPLDHFGECTDLKTAYLRCLKEHHFDNMSCRYLSKQYLECRMENNLMSKEPMEKLGFLTEENEAKPARQSGKQKSKEDMGWIVGVDNIKPQTESSWRTPRLFKIHDLYILLKNYVESKSAKS
mmetsp:Transcript_63312/g.151035  ORF Transcript_63312/g.151035 Transcript_63312/m.151035 type:complete len:143 (+) Transcript_63312:105-533(+)|eukprot:CAMPEP_0178412520 /NCGR_PEP_ID=MMETSP0689_2-20121128/22057_1 /TAXON_ID=160604 /ORGANISM="Amphidinium massartii, Strain CS-259" /LENGTH=142 /DNA_ID=CAMNT_0020033769 /DNA_START=20 /DNA_END=448 /DNA_ORIENTATION=-